jgi:acyl carrier protein
MNSLAVKSNATQIAPNAEAIASWLSQRIAKAMEILPSQVDPDITFDRYGLDSMESVSITVDLSEELGMEELPPTLLYDYPTINQLSTYLVGAVRSN